MTASHGTLSQYIYNLKRGGINCRRWDLRSLQRRSYRPDSYTWFCRDWHEQLCLRFDLKRLERRSKVSLADRSSSGRDVDIPFAVFIVSDVSLVSSTSSQGTLVKSGHAKSSIDVLVERIGATAPAHSAAGRELPITKTSAATDCSQGESQSIRRRQMASRNSNV